MKILHLSPLYPPHVGGLESHAAQFDEHLSASGISITVFTPRLPRSAPAHETKNHYLTIHRFPAVEIIPNYPFPALWRRAFWRQLRQLRAARPDLIISRTRFFSTSLLALVLSAVWRRTWLHIEHGSDFVSLRHPLLKTIARLYDQIIGRLVLKSADAVAANSRASARFVRLLSGRDARVIYRGIDHDAIANIPPADLTTNYPPSRRTRRNGGQTTYSIKIVFAGRLIDGKGVDDLLHAVAILRDDIRNSSPSSEGEARRGSLKLLIIGSGPQERRLKILCEKLALGRHVYFFSEKSFEETIAILKAADIFVNPSHTEGLPTSVIEAALCQVAIVATNVGGTSEIVTDGSSACLVPPQDPAQLAHAIAGLIENPSRRRALAQQARREVEQKFTWSTATAAYQALFSELTPSAKL